MLYHEAGHKPGDHEEMKRKDNGMGARAWVGILQKPDLTGKLIDNVWHYGKGPHI